ncbi:MAG: spore germination protein, partial [Firmicutes bacterium]|nr:spore germination protein [Bacillota bacterium]
MERIKKILSLMATPDNLNVRQVQFFDKNATIIHHPDITDADVIFRIALALQNADPKLKNQIKNIKDLSSMVLFSTEVKVSGLDNDETSGEESEKNKADEKQSDNKKSEKNGDGDSKSNEESEKNSKTEREEGYGKNEKKSEKEKENSENENSKNKENDEKIDDSNADSSAASQENSTERAIIDEILLGDAVVLVDGWQGYLTISAKKWDKRGIMEPPAETVLRG